MVKISLSTSNVIDAINKITSDIFAVAHYVPEDLQMGRVLAVNLK